MAQTNTLTVGDAKLLADQERIIGSAVQKFTEAGAALAIIRERRLYRITHPNFAAYCADRWRLTERYARYLIGAAELANAIPIPMEKVGRALESADGDPAEVFARATEKAGGDPAKVRVAHVREADAELAGEVTDATSAAMDPPPDVLDRAAAYNSLAEATVQKLRDAKNEFLGHLQQTAGAAVHIDTMALLRCMKAAADAVLSSKAHAVCGYCSGTTQVGASQCRACSGLGWQTKIEWINVEESRKGSLIP